MATTTLSLFSPLLKRTYTRLFSEHINENTPWLTIVKGLGREVVLGEDQEIRHPFITKQPQQIVYTGEGGTYPTPGNSAGIQGVLDVTHMLATIGWTGQVIEAANKGERGAFANAVDFEMRSLKKSLDKEMSVDSMTRRDGVIGRVNNPGSTDSTTLTLDNTEVTGPGNRWMFNGMTITAMDTLARTGTESTTLNGSVLTNSGVSWDNRAQVTLTATAIGEDNYFIRRDGTITDDSAHGVLDWLDNTSITAYTHFAWGASGDTTIWGQTRTTNASLQSNILHNSNVVRAIDESLIRQAFDQIGTTQGFADEGEYFLISNLETATAYLDLQDGKQQYHNINNLQTGIRGFTVGNVHVGNVLWVIDPAWPIGTIGIINPTTWSLHEARESGFDDHMTGTIFKPGLSSPNYTDNVLTNYKHYWNLACYDPRQNALITDVDTTV